MHDLFSCVKVMQIETIRIPYFLRVISFPTKRLNFVYKMKQIKQK